MTACRSRSLAATAGAFVAAIPAPIVASPLASRVIDAQPPAASASAQAQSPRGSGPVPATASTRAADTISGMWLMAATYVSWARASSRNGLAPQALARTSTRSTAASSARPGTSTHGRSRNRSPSAAANPRDLAARHRVAADEPEPERRRLVHDRGLGGGDVGDDGVRREERRDRPGELVEQREALARRRRRARRGPLRRPRPRSSRRRGRARRRRRPRGDRPRAASTRRRSSAPAASVRQRAGDRPADQPQPEERDAHGRLLLGDAAAEPCAARPRAVRRPARAARGRRAG